MSTKKEIKSLDDLGLSEEEAKTFAEGSRFLFGSPDDKKEEGERGKKPPGKGALSDYEPKRSGKDSGKHKDSKKS